MAMTWEDQKMNVITAAVVVVIGGMVAWHLFGGETGKAGHPTPSAGFAAPSAAPAGATGHPEPTATTSPAAATPVAPASIPLGESFAGQAANPTPVASPTPGRLPGVVVRKNLHTLQGDIQVLQQEVQELSTALANLRQAQLVEARRTRVRLDALAASHAAGTPPTWTFHRQLVGYHLQSIGGTQAWLTNPAGETVIARAGEHLPGLQILAIAPQGVKTSAGWLGF